MNQERLLRLLQSPLMTEKAYRFDGEGQQVVFKVVKDANKGEIKQAVEFVFGVKVEAVRTLNMKSKQRRFGKMQGKTQAWKKAYVRLAKDSKIDFGLAEA